MNIIISQDRSIRLTQQREAGSLYQIEDFTIYIAKTLSFSNIYLILEVNGNKYPFYLLNSGEVKNYKFYTVAFTEPVSLTERVYSISVKADEENFKIGDFPIRHIKREAAATFAMQRDPSDDTPYGLTDANEPIYIQDRIILIDKSNNTVVAEDNISQILTFRVPRYYEGVDLQDKLFYFDYIDLLTKKLLNIYFKENWVKKDIEIDGVEYIDLLLPITYDLTHTSGDLNFALSAIGSELIPDLTGGSNTSRQYVWQTEKAILKILPNLAKRNEIPQQEGQDSPMEAFIARIDNLDDELSKIMNTDLPEFDAVKDNEIILDGGGVPPEYLEEGDM